MLHGNGGGGFGARADYATGARPVSVISADFNRDGKLDLATANQTAGTVSVLLADVDADAVARRRCAHGRRGLGRQRDRRARQRHRRRGTPIEITGVTEPAERHGTVVQGAPDTIPYTPDPDYCNDPGAAPTDDFTYTITGGDTATVSVTVTCVRRRPGRGG